jgi:hypothetical protein
LNAQDCGTVEAVMTKGSLDSAGSWCTDVAHLTDLDVHGHFTESESDHPEFVNVPVTFNLTWRAFHDDGTMDEGAPPRGATAWCATRRTPLGASSTRAPADEVAARAAKTGWGPGVLSPQ